MTITLALIAALLLAGAPAIGLGGIISGIAGVKGLFDSFNQGKAADRAARAGADAQARMVALAEEDRDLNKKWYARAQEIYDQMVKDGTFDLSTRFQLAENEVNEFRNDNLENTGAMYRTMGYKAGDTVMEKGFAETEARDADALRRLRTDLRSRVPMEQFAALGMTKPDLAGTSQVIGALDSQSGYSMMDANRRYGLAGEPSQFLAGILPFAEELFSKKKTYEQYQGPNMDLLYVDPNAGGSYA
jgi:hypothetical protein